LLRVPPLWLRLPGLLDFHSLPRSYGTGAPVLRGVSFAVGGGRTLALVGATQRSPAGGPGEGGSGGGAGAAVAAGGHGGAEGLAEGAIDDLLFFADKEGDATMFCRCAFCLHLQAAWLPGCLAVLVCRHRSSV
jgi:hypothetical protein